VPRRGIENTIKGKGVASPKSRPWGVLAMGSLGCGESFESRVACGLS
jgi:hypothetical protein